MIALTLAEVADAVDGTLSGGAAAQAVVSGRVTTDSRSVAAGDLFVAIVGETHDAHDYAVQAHAAGAVAVLAARPLDVPCIVVDDTVVALGLLARAVLDRLDDVVVVGVTGSSGKTSTKDLLAHVLANVGPTVAPRESFNNEIGLPVSALDVDSGTRVLVSEMSARGVGHIRYLTGITPPRIGVVLNVGTAHLGEFGSREVVAAAKGELLEALPAATAGGVAVLNVDDPLVAAMSVRTSARVVTVGRGSVADVRAVDVTLDDDGRPSFHLARGGESRPVSMRLHGAHHVGNALATAAVALELGLDLDVVAGSLSSALPASRWRMEVTSTAAGVTVVNDAYNANPESVRAALEALVAMSRATDDRPRRRTWAVLGEMRELGATAASEHEEIGRTAVRLGVDVVVAVGAGAEPVRSGGVLEGGSPEGLIAVPDVDTAVTLLRREVSSGDVVLVKASRSIGLERVAAALLEDAT